MICSLKTVCTAYGQEIQLIIQMLIEKRPSKTQIQMLIVLIHTFLESKQQRIGLVSSSIMLQLKIGGLRITMLLVMLILQSWQQVVLLTCTSLQERIQTHLPKLTIELWEHLLLLLNGL